MPNRAASSPASPCVWSVPRLRAGGGDSGDDLTMAPARKLVLDSDRGLVSGEADDASVENIFQQAQQIAIQADQLLVGAE